MIVANKILRIVCWLFLFAFFSCGDSQKKKEISLRDSLFEKIRNRDNVKICDTCLSVLVVSHQECTECRDLYVDSGILFLPRKILIDFDTSITIKGHKMKLNTSDLCLEDRADFYRLWPENNYDFRKKFRVTGKVVRNEKHSLKFKIYSFEEIGNFNEKQ
jgi:hypothetical protein